jgi:hypothetical protein
MLFNNSLTKGLLQVRKKFFYMQLPKTNYGWSAVFHVCLEQKNNWAKKITPTSMGIFFPMKKAGFKSK